MPTAGSNTDPLGSGEPSGPSYANNLTLLGVNQAQGNTATPLGNQNVTNASGNLAAAVFGATQQTPILYQNHIFGVRPDGQLVCLDLSGKVVWASGAKNKFGSGPYLMAQGMIYVMDDNGTLTLAEASTAGYTQLARAKVLEGPDAWGPMALADGRLIARDVNKMVCLDVAAH